MSGYLQVSSLRLRHGWRAATVLFVFLLVVAVYHNPFRRRTSPDLASNSETAREGEEAPSPSETLVQCASYGRARAGLSQAVKLKVDALIEDKFTIAISTFRRPKELNDTVTILTSTKISSLLEIVVVWNNIGEAPPEPFISEHGVKVRYRASTKNSLNEKFTVDPAYQTRAILLSDDDVYLRPSDLEFAFQMWREFGRNRITGVLARCCSLSSSTKAWDYNFCENGEFCNLVLTNLAFVDIAYLEYYSSQDADMVQIREYVDKVFNCEDLALNFVVSRLTCCGPLLVRGREPHVNYDPQAGLSRNPGHMDTRSKCLNEFSKIFGVMPLVEESGRAVRGLDF